MSIAPDTKNWTWVIQRRCPECGFDAPAFAREAVGRLLEENAAAWQALLRTADDPARRPAPDIWSLLEYACHVRDVCRIFDGRLRLMLTQEGPLFANWDQDATAVAECYATQDPETVAAELGVAAAALATRFDGVSGPAWSRTGSRSDGSEFTVETFARYFMHDPVHHLYDVTGTIRAAG